MKRCLDLFSGAASGWTLGVHRAGWRTVAACEADPWRRAVFSVNWPDVEMFDDVRTLTAARLAHLMPIDAIIGSPPCQDASSANARGKGVDGTRTGLFWEMVRLAEEIRPRWLLAENVPGIRTRGIDQILDRLERTFDCWPIVIGADDVGAPHRRKRMWLVCARKDVAARLSREGAPWPSR